MGRNQPNHKPARAYPGESSKVKKITDRLGCGGVESAREIVQIGAQRVSEVRNRSLVFGNDLDGQALVWACRQIGEVSACFAQNSTIRLRTIALAVWSGPSGAALVDLSAKSGEENAVFNESKEQEK